MGLQTVFRKVPCSFISATKNIGQEYFALCMLLLTLKKKQTKPNYKRHEVTDTIDCILSQSFLYTIILCLLFERLNATLIAGICYVFRYTITMEGQMIMRNPGQSCNSVTF